MMKDTLWFARRKRHVEGVKHDPRLEVVGERPPNDPARPGVEHDRQEQETGKRRNERDVGDPQFVRPVGDEVPSDEIVRRTMVAIALVVGALRRRLTPASAAAHIRRAMRFLPIAMPSAFISAWMRGAP
ncbi:hypothetical protein SAMN05444581_11585 [Methylocapsa palsarum]|uniref:Uncharacterized protein n=1 Tax=Methylocapsa palsarum TaxID=1612308 RepID=A0A1I4BL54_9HYPH|nr:hypothetical protein SAMN05444581_11585 [Methylocapsa palsarum]